jgi:hypothetical protein
MAGVTSIIVKESLEEIGKRLSQASKPIIKELLNVKCFGFFRAFGETSCSIDRLVSPKARKNPLTVSSNRTVECFIY